MKCGKRPRGNFYQEPLKLGDEVEGPSDTACNALSDEPRYIGLVDQTGVPIYRQPAPVGFRIPKR